MIRKLLFAILLGTGMAACLSQQDDTSHVAQNSDTTEQASTPAAPDPAAFVVEKGRVGEVKIGMLIDTMRQQVAPGFTIMDTTLQQEGQTATAYLLYPATAPQGILIEQQCAPECRVWRIQVLHQAFKTAAGIGVGSKYSEVQQAYPISSVTYEEGNLVAISEKAGISFVLDATQLSTERLSSLTASTLPANAVVKRLLVY